MPTGDTNVTPRQDPNNPRRLIVTIDAPVGTFFARVLGINSFPASRTSEADYVLPVPMGSPLNYYGIGCLDTNEINGRTRPSCASGSDSNGPSGISTATSDDGTTGGGAQNQLSSQGFWGAVFTKGGDSRNGDAYMPTQISNGGANASNPDYDPSGYGYTVEVPSGGGGRVYVFDPTFCDMPRLGSGKAGTGDEWTTNLGGTNPAGMTTYFNLYDTHDTPFELGDDTLVYTSGSLFENESQNDQSGQYGTGSPANVGVAGVDRCDQPTDRQVRVPPALVAAPDRRSRPGHLSAAGHDVQGGHLERRRRDPRLLGERRRRSGQPLRSRGHERVGLPAHLRRWPDGRVRQRPVGHAAVLPRPDRQGIGRRQDRSGSVSTTRATSAAARGSAS